MVQNDIWASFTCSSLGLCLVLKRDTMGSEFESYTEWLVEEARGFADWRTRDAESFPEDLRILQSSDALRALADRMSELPADHPKIQRLWRLWFGPARSNGRRGKTRALDLITIVSDELQQYGYDSADDGDPERFLDSLVDGLEQLLGRSPPDTK